LKVKAPPIVEPSMG